MRSILTACILVLAPISAEAKTLTGQAIVIDGDTLEIHGEPIRLGGIDAPESRQTCLNGAGVAYRCGKEASFALADLIGRATVTCVGNERDRYHRLLATCSAHGIDLNGWMVEQGHAVAYLRYATTYVVEEGEARAARRGVWQGEFVMPWDWRKAH